MPDMADVPAYGRYGRDHQRTVLGSMPRTEREPAHDDTFPR